MASLRRPSHSFLYQDALFTAYYRSGLQFLFVSLGLSPSLSITPASFRVAARINWFGRSASSCRAADCSAITNFFLRTFSSVTRCSACSCFEISHLGFLVHVLFLARFASSFTLSSTSSVSVLRAAEGKRSSAESHSIDYLCPSAGVTYYYIPLT